jgi:hypothetical protein
MRGKEIESLLSHIQFRLAVRKFCIVSERELERAWPMNENREAAIMEFSRVNKLDAAFVADRRRAFVLRNFAVDRAGLFPASSLARPVGGYGRGRLSLPPQ